MPRKWEPSDPDDLVQRYLTGESVQALARSLGISRGPMTRFLIGRGVTLRDRSDALVNRWKRLDKEGRDALVGAAHQARRNTIDSTERRQARALHAQASLRYVSRGENEMADLLRTLGHDPVPQLAVKGYNLDLALHPVAVEIHRHPRNPINAPGTRERLHDLPDWLTVFVWCNPRHGPNGLPTLAAAEQVIATYKHAKRDPSTIGEYRVIRGSGELVASGRLDLNHRP